MKKKHIVFLSVIIIVAIATFGGFAAFRNMNTTSIKSVLSQKSYSYLPKEAKNYIEKVYKETGEIVKTEKNKEDNEPYLNPKYIEYLELSEKEKKDIDLIPDAYILDYSINQTYGNSNLPATFDLRNRNGRNYVSPIKNQGTTSICWAFATIENVETLYMKNNQQSYSDLVPKFSIRQMDYITSTNYLALKGNWSSGLCTYSNCTWTNWDNANNGSHELDKGGNFYASSIAMSNGITLTNESVMPWHEEKKPVLVNDIYGYDKSLYEVNSTIQMPTINADNPSQELVNSYVNSVKNYMLEYGGPFVGTYSPQSTCGFQNRDGSKVLKTDNCVSDTNTKDLGHAMQIIGWDDNYEYSYCESGTTHKSVNSNGTCSSGVLTTGKGAWILRNSWGTATPEAQAYSYFYLTYDSTRLSIGFTTSISKMQNRTWDNNYHSNPWIEGKISNGMVSVESQTKSFNTHNNKSEKVEKIKFFASSKNGTYNVSILTNNKNYNNVGTITTTESGIYTINLSDKNVILSNKEFQVKIESQNGAQFINDSISVFTSNTNTAPSIETNYKSGIVTYEDPNGKPSEENVAFIISSKETTVKLEHYLKNVSDYKKITYKALLDGVEYNRYFFDNYNSISSNMTYIDGKVTTILDISKEDYSDVDVCGKVYTFQILYDNTVIESFPVKRICKNWDNKSTDYTKSTIKFHKNDGSGYYSAITKNDTSSFNIMKSDGTGNEYIGDESKFFQYDKYITGWNTKPDGTGTTYTNNEYFVYRDMDLYAQWSNPQTQKHQYYIKLECGNTTCSSGYSRTMTITFNENFTIPDTQYGSQNSNMKFIHWTFDEDNDTPIYYEEEVVKNISKHRFSSPYNKDESFNLYGVWSDSYHSVSFNANNGTGTMKDIKIINNKSARLKYNLFKKTGYRFAGWNTKANGTGTAYTDGQNVSLTNDITLYAQWEEIQNHTVTFYANDGTTRSDSQEVEESVSTPLKKNAFTRSGYTFKNWNTKADGTGTTYTDGQSVSLTNDITLYAQWDKPITKINLSTTNIRIEVGETKAVTAEVSPSDTTMNKAITWTSDNDKIATVSSNGRITGKKVGTTIIKATAVNGVSANVTVEVTEKASFQDVPTDSWFYDAVRFVYQNGIIMGYNKHEFGSYDYVTRGQLVTMLWRLEGEPETNNIQNRFTDVDVNSYYGAGVKWASANGIVNGYGGTNKFGPGDPIIRQDFTVILNNYIRYKGLEQEGTQDLKIYADYNRVAGGYAEHAIRWATTYGVMNGMTIDGRKYISPFSSTTRAETAALLSNLVQRFNLI